MTCHRRIAWASCLAVLAVAAAAAQQEKQPSRAIIDARCEEALQKMSKHLKEMKSFSIAAEVICDEIDGEQTLTFTKRMEGDIQRPNRARGKVVGDVYRKSYCYDGKQIAVVDEDQRVYSVVDAPDTLDAMFDMMADKYGLAMPISDLLFSDPYATLMDGVRGGRFVGMHKIGSHNCQHLAFTQETLDWQIWIEAGEHPFPRRLVITYKDLPGAPKFMATFTKWEAVTGFKDNHFAFEPPKDAQKIDLVPIDAEETTQPSGGDAAKP